jgi:hypothetical protein
VERHKYSEFYRKYPDSTVPHKATVYNDVTKQNYVLWIGVGQKRISETDVLRKTLIPVLDQKEAIRNHSTLWFFSLGWQKVQLTLVQSC